MPTPEPKFTYHLECPCLDNWNNFKQGTLSYCQGFLDALRGQAPRLHYRLVRSDGRVIDEISPIDSVNIGMVAGWPSAEQYERAGAEAYNRAAQIRRNQRAYNRRTLGKTHPEPVDKLSLMFGASDLPDDRPWRDAAIQTGLYQADRDVSTPDKWLSAQADAAAALLTEVENLRRWKAEQLEVMRQWAAVDAAARAHPLIRIGDSVAGFILKLLEARPDTK